MGKHWKDHPTLSRGGGSTTTSPVVSASMAETTYYRYPQFVARNRQFPLGLGIGGKQADFNTVITEKPVCSSGMEPW